MKTPRIGAIGGGQLARMMTPPAIHLGLDFKVLAEAEGSSAGLAVTMVGDYHQIETVEQFADSVDVITFDHEHVPLDVLRVLEVAGVSVQPPSKALAFAQNKLQMRKRLGELNLPMPRWAEIKTSQDLDRFIQGNDGVAVLKTPIGGYDGKGVRVVRSAEDAADWFSKIEDFGGSLLAEQKVNFVGEVAQLSARTPSGDFRAWPLVETIQENGVCATVIAPRPNTSPAMFQRAEQIAKTVADGLGVTGVLAVEMFVTSDGDLLINELAMRPHNSGHFSIEGAVTSQFEQHLRAVLDLPLGDTSLKANWSVMVNLLGVDDSNTFVGNFHKAMRMHPTAKLHTYGKGARKGRKMGHITVVADDLDFALNEARAAAAVLLQG